MKFLALLAVGKAEFFVTAGFTQYSVQISITSRATPTRGRTSYERKVGLRTYARSSGSGFPETVLV